jgi:hypothetical protein
MGRSIFGTDGVRGRANVHPMTAETALRLGQAAGRLFRRGADHGRVVIGKDTRLSGYMIESALQAGFTSAGMNVFLLGPVPTPAVGMLTRSLRADVGVMVSASHNPYQDNGVKFFGPDGFKLSDEAEAEIEALMEDACGLAAPDEIGRAKRIEGGAERYVEFAKATFPKGCRWTACASWSTAPTAPPTGPRRQCSGSLGGHRAARRQSRRLQHQRRLRLYRARGMPPQGRRDPRRSRSRPRRRRRPRPHHRRDRPYRGWRPDHGADRPAVGR